MSEADLEVVKELVRTAIADVNYYYMVGTMEQEAYSAILKDLSAIQDRLYK